MPTVIGLDIAKRFFRLRSVDPETGEMQRSKLQRSELLEHFGNLAPSIVAMEACGSSQHWARRFTAMGHEVRLIATKFVRPFV
jgi:transposase